MPAARTTATETKQTLTEQALHAAEQNMTDVLTLWANGRTSDLALGEALKDMKNDGLKLVKAARKAGLTPEERAFKADLLLRAETAERHCEEFGALADYYKSLAPPVQEPSLQQLRAEGFLRT